MKELYLIALKKIEAIFTLSPDLIDLISLLVQWLRFYAPHSGGPGSVPGLDPMSTNKDPACHN